jgi:hypothetical protein
MKLGIIGVDAVGAATACLNSTVPLLDSTRRPLEYGCWAHTLSCRCRHNPTRA